MLFSQYRTLVLEEGSPWNRATAEVGAMHRLAPILMTTLVSALCLLPLALGRHALVRKLRGRWRW